MNPSMTDLEINQIARKEMGKAAWPTIIFGALSVALYFGTIGAAISGILPVIAAFPLSAYLVYAVYTPLHEAVHNNIAGDNKRLRILNLVIGHLVGSILGIPYAVHKPGHMEHHRSTNVAGKDPDFMFTSNSVPAVLATGPCIVFREYVYYFKRVYPRASGMEKILVWSEISVAIGWRVGLALAGYPLEAFVLGLLAALAGISFLGIVFAWIVHTPFNETERYKNTATIFLPKPIHRVGTWFWLWQNYHSIHHLFPRVPFYRYRVVYDQIHHGMGERGAPVVGMQQGR